jgi:hemin uptake protein HemP
MRIIIIKAERHRSAAMSVIVQHRPRISLPSMQPAAPVAAPAGSAVDSQRLLQGRSEVLIRHGNETYRLRHTRNDKLILTK